MNTLFWFLVLVFGFFLLEVGTFTIAQDCSRIHHDPKVVEALLPWLPQCWDYRCEPSHLPTLRCCLHSCLAVRSTPNIGIDQLISMATVVMLFLLTLLKVFLTHLLIYTIVMSAGHRKCHCYKDLAIKATKTPPHA